MARDADTTSATAKNWLSILQASGIIYLLEPYHSNVTKSLVKAPKLYFGYRTLQLSDRMVQPGNPGGVICLAEMVLPITENVQCIPVAAL